MGRRILVNIFATWMRQTAFADLTSSPQHQRPKPRVAVLIPSLRGGGCERQVANLLEDLESRYSFELLVKEDDIAFDIPPSIPVHCSRIDTSPHHSELFKAWRFARRVFATGRALRAGNYDLIWTFIDLNNVVTFFAARLFRVAAPIVSVEQTVIPEYFEHDPLARKYMRVMRMLLRLVYARVDRMVTLTHAIADLLRSFGVRRAIDVIDPGVDAKRFRPRDDGECADPTLEATYLAAPIRVLSVGGLIKRKDPELLVRAMRLVVAAQPEAHLFLLGDGPLKPQVTALIEELGLSRSVHVLGWRADVDEYVRFADLSVLASSSDPLPQVLLESLMCGVPVVTTRSTSEWDRVLTEPQLGRIVDVRDERELADAIQGVLGETDKRQRHAIAGYARARFDRSLMATAYSRVLDDCLSVNRPVQKR